MGTGSVEKACHDRHLGFTVPITVWFPLVVVVLVAHGPARAIARATLFCLRSFVASRQPERATGKRKQPAAAGLRQKKLLDIVLNRTGWLLEKLCLGKNPCPGLSLNH